MSSAPLRWTEADARAVLLVRAFETPPAAPWSEADADAVTREARRIEGEGASAESFVACRARLACERLAERGVTAAAALPSWLPWLLVPFAFAAGLVSDAIASGDRVNLLALHLWGLLAWNAAVYALFIVSSLSGRPRRSRVADAVERLQSRRRGGDGSTAAQQRFAVDWAQAAGSLHTLRVASALHAAAAAFALGVVASLYTRGLVVEYRAGWDSTFLGPEAVHRLLQLVLGPASMLSGVALPGADALGRLRFAAGSGENAASWIHLFAITLGLFVMLPRLLLAALSSWRARRLARALPLPAEDAYVQRLLRARSGSSMPVRVTPYSYRLGDGLLAGLRSALERQLGTSVVMEVADPVPLGGEDELPPATPSDAVPVVLFALTATPEEEHHGAFVSALSRSRDGLIVIVDESGFSQRFAGADGATRRAQRRDAWERMLRAFGQTAVFVDLASAGDALMRPIPDRADPAARSGQGAPDLHP